MEESDRILGRKRHRDAMARKADSPASRASNANPAEWVMSEMTHDSCANPTRAPPLEFRQPSEEMVAAYTKEVVDALRTERVDELKRLHDAGCQLECANRFGESILHMACRRSLTDVVRFLVQDAKVSVLVRDDFGRTALHFAFWTPTPNVELVRFLVEQVPELLCVEDVRGCTPLHYIRNEHKDQWYNFFQEHRALLHRSCNVSESTVTKDSQGPEESQSSLDTNDEHTHQI